MFSTARLRLRDWLEADRIPFRTINADPRVMRYFPSTLNAAESDALLERITYHIHRHGFGFWAVEHRETARLIGFVGLQETTIAIPRLTSSMPWVEIGWRLAYDDWGQGYASEAAYAALTFGFERLKLAEIISFAAQANLRSQRVMQRLGMIRAKADDFDHPLLPVGHPLSRHVLYRLPRILFQAVS